MTNPADILETAADLIEANGLYKGDFWPLCGLGVDYQEGVSLCTLGALTVANAQLHNQSVMGSPIIFVSDVVDALMDTAGLTHKGNGYTNTTLVAAWSDDPERTGNEVVDTLRRAAKELRNVA